MAPSVHIKPGNNFWSGHFRAMASPCEILIDTSDRVLAERLVCIAQGEALRIENKFSRYRDDNIIYRINHSAGQQLEVDAETAALLDYAEHCYQISNGMFDITSGVLRRVWQFDGSDNVPQQAQVAAIAELLGWHRVNWKRPMLTLPEGFEIDMGGICKEYAVDRSAMLLAAQTDVSFLINYGGDLYANKPRRSTQGWVIGVEQPGQGTQPADINQPSAAVENFELCRGGVATSGDARRFLLKDGVRYSHILNPLTGWPVGNAPRSVTVLANSCTEAGILSTLAMLQGQGAEAFLAGQHVQHWVLRD
jgi:thiamine biosynthesis lipoprotein